MILMRAGDVVLFKKGLLSLMALLLVMSSGLTASAAESNIGYSDVDGHWAQSLINDVTRKGLFSGYENGEFRPDNSISRMEYITILYRTLNRNEVTFPPDIGLTLGVPYEDVDEDYWGYGSLESVLSLTGENSFKVVFGSDDEAFYPNQPITRGEAAEITGKFNADTYIEDRVEIDFTDVESYNLISALEELVTTNIFTGYNDNTFRPNNPITRAEAAAVISRFDEWLQNNLNYEPINMGGLFPATSPTLMDSYENHNSSLDQEVQQLFYEIGRYPEENEAFAQLINKLDEEDYWNKAFVNYYKTRIETDLPREEKIDLLIEAAEFVNNGEVDQPLIAGRHIYGSLYSLTIATDWIDIDTVDQESVDKISPYIEAWYELVTKDLERDDAYIISDDPLRDFAALITAYWFIEGGELEKAKRIYETFDFINLSKTLVAFHNYLFILMEMGVLTTFNIDEFKESSLEYYILSGFDSNAILNVSLDGSKIKRILIKEDNM